MTTYKICDVTSVQESEFSTPSSTCLHPLGMRVKVESTTGLLSEYEYICAAGAALTAYQPYIKDLGGTTGATTTINVKLTAPVTLGAPGAIVAIPQVAFTSGYYGWVLVKGYGKALHYAETYIKGDMLQLLSGGTSLVVDGSTGSTIKLVNTCGQSLDSGTTAVAKAVYLNGEQAVIAAT